MTTDSRVAATSYAARKLSELSRTSRFHFAIRIPSVTRVDKTNVDTIRVHNAKVAAEGEALFAKFGAPVLRATLDALNEQIGKGLETRLIVVSKIDNAFVGYQSRLVAIYPKEHKIDLRTLVPSYYSRLDQSPSVWFRIDRQFQICDLTKVALVTNKRRLIDVVAECRTTAMLVKDI